MRFWKNSDVWAFASAIADGIHTRLAWTCLLFAIGCFLLEWKHLRQEHKEREAAMRRHAAYYTGDDQCQTT